MPRATAEERELLAADFVRLCEIESPSRLERAIADAVAVDLRAAGLEVSEDASATSTGSDAGNLIARIPAPEGAPTVLFCAHLDTVPLAAPVEVVREGGVFSNRNDGILGADNKAAVAVLLGLARRLARLGSPVGVELLFTTCEEIGLVGAKQLGHELRSDFGFAFDHATPIGQLIGAAPSHYGMLADFSGAAAHAGIQPEAGRNAIAAAATGIAALRLGRIDEGTTANVGVIEGGSASNVVPDRCRVLLEARSLEEATASDLIGEMMDALTEAASNVDCSVEFEIEQHFRAYKLARSARTVQIASAALSDLGFEPSLVDSGGGSDANALIASGLEVLNVANGTRRPHEPEESVTVEALETMLDVTLQMVERSAAQA